MWEREEVEKEKEEEERERERERGNELLKTPHSFLLCYCPVDAVELWECYPDGTDTHIKLDEHNKDLQST